MQLAPWTWIAPLGAALVLTACTRSSGDDRPKTAPAADPDQAASTSLTGEPSPDSPRVVFAPEGKPEVTAYVEVVRTPRQIQRGLMYRRHLPPDAGMLFLFPESKVQSFWMKNTLIPLDMIFVSEDMKVVGVVENAEPLTLTSRTVGVESQFVIEVNGGWTAKHGVGAGTAVRFENVEPLAPGEGDYD